MRVVQSEHRQGMTGGIEPHRKVGKKRPGCGPKELQPATVKCKTAKWLVPSTLLHPPHALLLPFWPKASPVCMNRPPPPTQSKLYSGAAETSTHTPKTGRRTCMVVSMPVPRAPKARGNLSPRRKNTPRHQTYTYSRNGRHAPWRHFISVCMCNLMSILEEGERSKGKTEKGGGSSPPSSHPGREESHRQLCLSPPSLVGKVHPDFHRTLWTLITGCRERVTCLEGGSWKRDPRMGGRGRHTYRKLWGQETYTRMG